VAPLAPTHGIPVGNYWSGDFPLIFFVAMQAALVIHGLFSANLLIYIDKIDHKGQFSSQKMVFYLRIRDSRSKMMERIYLEKRGKPVFVNKKMPFQLMSNDIDIIEIVTFFSRILNPFFNKRIN